MDANWGEIRNATYQVVLLTQRDNGFWGYPTATWEPLYAIPDSEDAKLRSKEAFGHASISVTWSGLRALKGLGEASRIIDRARVSATLNLFADPQGGFGTPQIAYPGRRVNATPRHTAMGILAAGELNSTSNSAARVKQAECHIRWLLKVALRSGGWPTLPYGRGELGFLTTAAVIAALSYFVHHASGTGSQLADRAQQAALKGLRVLHDAREGALWTSNDGGGPRLAYRDAAQSLDLLLLPESIAALHPERNLLGAMIGDFAATATPRGWPGETSRTELDWSATIQGLLTIDIARAAGFAEAGADSGLISESICEGWERGDLQRQLMGSDWPTLGSLAAARAGPVEWAKQTEAVQLLAELVEKREAGTLYKDDLDRLEPKISSVAEFVLSRNAGLEPRPSKLKKSGRELVSDMFKKGLFSGIAALFKFFWHLI